MALKIDQHGFIEMFQVYLSNSDGLLMLSVYFPSKQWINLVADTVLVPINMSYGLKSLSTNYDVEHPTFYVVLTLQTRLTNLSVPFVVRSFVKKVITFCGR